MRAKPRIRALRNNPGIAHANLRSLLRKPWIHRFYYVTQTSDRHNHLGSRIQTWAIRGSKPTIDRASKAARPFAAKKPRSIAHAKQLGYSRGDHGFVACRAGMRSLPIDRGFVAADVRAAWRAQSIVVSLPGMAELPCVRDRL